MKIACLISSLQEGGAERQLVSLAAVLAADGHDVEIITYHKSDFYSGLVEEKGIRHRFIDRKGTLLHFIVSLKEYLTDFDLMIAFQAGTSLKACLAKMLAGRKGFRLIVSERNLSQHFLPHDAFRFLCYRMLAEKVVCNNFSQEQFIRKHFPSISDKTLTISNFVDSEKFAPSAGHIPHSPRRIIVSARLCRRKNATGLIKAVAMMKDADMRIDWFGAAKENAYSRKCLKMIRNLGLEDRFFIHPATVRIEEEYVKSDIFCLPSFYEGTSNSLAEALSCGLPVVCSRVSDNPRYVEENVNGFMFNPHLPSEIAAALSRALALDGEKYSRACEESREIALTRLSRETFTQKYRSIII